MKPPREVVGWDDYFLAIAKTVSIRSKDPDTQVGGVVADENRRIVATGYNGAPAGIDDAALDWSRPAKYAHTLHAEGNALLNATRANLAGCTLYVTGRPCSTCMLLIAAKGIKRVVFSPMPIHMCDDDEWAKTLRIADLCGIDVEERVLT